MAYDEKYETEEEEALEAETNLKELREVREDA